MFSQRKLSPVGEEVVIRRASGHSEPHAEHLLSLYPMLLSRGVFLLAKEKITSFFSRSTRPESQFEQWDATSYIDMARQPEYRSEEALHTLLTANFVSFAAEYTRGEVVSTFEMDVDPSRGILGMVSSYIHGIMHIGENFEEKLENKGKNITRAQLETTNMLKLDQWSVSAPVGSLFVWNSPPGKVSEGYAGLNSHSFIFVYEKTSPTTVVLHQYRTWMNLEQHTAFQNLFLDVEKQPTAASPLTSHQIIATTHITSPEQMGMSSSLEVISFLEEKAYESSQAWRIKPHEMPQIDDEEYEIFRDFLLGLYIQKVVPVLLAEVPQTEDASSEEWQVFVQSKNYATLVKKLDLAFGVLAYQPLVKWVEATDQTPQSENILRRLFYKKEKTTITSLSQTEIQNGLFTMYELQLAKLRGEKINKEQAQTYSSLAHVLLSATSKGLSLGQCGIGTFVPTKLLTTPLNSVSLSAPVPLSPGMATGLPAKEKLQLVDHLSTLSYLPLMLPNGQLWYIKAKYFNEYSSYFASNSLELSEKGIPIGPCGWALRGDPRGDDELVLTAQEYTQLQALQAMLIQDLHDNPEESFDAFASTLLDTAHSDSEKEELREIVTLLKEALKKTVAVGDLLFNEFFDTFALLSHPLLLHISKKVALSEFIVKPEQTASAVLFASQSY